MKKLFKNIPANKTDLVPAVLYSALIISLPFKGSLMNILFGMIILWEIFQIFKTRQYNFTYSIREPWVIAAMLLTLLALSLFWSTDFTRGINDLSMKIPLVLGLLFLKSSPKKMVIMKALLYTSFLSFAICIGYAIYLNYQEGYNLSFVLNAIINGVEKKDYRYDYFNYYYFTYQHLTRPIGIQPIYYGIFLNIALVHYVECTIKDNRLLRFSTITTVIFFMTALLLVSSRAQLLFGLGYLISRPILRLFTLEKKYRKSGLISLIVIVGMVSLVSLLTISNPIIRERITSSISLKKEKWGGLHERLQKWESSVKVIKNHPILGVGAGDDQSELLTQYAKDDFETGLKYKYNAHNQFLQYGLKIGIPGIILFLYLFWSSYRNNPKNPILIAILMLFLFSCLTESIMERNKGVIYFCIFAAIHLKRIINPLSNPDIKNS